MQWKIADKDTLALPELLRHNACTMNHLWDAKSLPCETAGAAEMAYSDNYPS